MVKKTYLQNITLLTLMLGCLLLTSGCGSKIKYGAANIVSTPAGAEVVNLKDSTNLGITPVHVSFTGEADSSEFITIQVRKIGYRDRITAFWINKRHDSEEKAEEDAVDIHVELEKREK